MTAAASILDHATAVKALLTGDPLLYDGQVPHMPSYPYRVLYQDTGMDDATKLCNDTDKVDVRFQITSVGITADAARICAGISYAQLVDALPIVDGRVCTRIKRETSIPVRPDTSVTLTDTDLNPMFAVDTYHFVSYPA